MLNSTPHSVSYVSYVFFLRIINYVFLNVHLNFKLFGSITGVIHIGNSVGKPGFITILTGSKLIR